MTTILAVASWLAGSCVSAELLGYLLHRLLHSGMVGFLSRNRMRHHLVLYGPLQRQRSREYLDATDERTSLGNIGIEWLAPAALLIVVAAAKFRVFHVRALFQSIYFGTTVLWSFLMFSYLHDRMHIDGFWLGKKSLAKALVCLRARMPRQTPLRYERRGTIVCSELFRKTKQCSITRGIDLPGRDSSLL